MSNSDNLIISIDLGTSNIKGAVYDLDGAEIAFKSIEYDLYMPSRGIVENDALKYWRTLLDIINYLVFSIRDKPGNINILSISSQGETIVPVDKKGDPLHNAIVWLDGRTKEEAKKIACKFDSEEMFRLTGNPEVNPSWPATRIKWFQNNKPEVFKKAYKFLLIEDYIIYKLTGKFIGEASVYNSSYYYNVFKSDYIDEMLDYLDISREKLPDIVKPGSIISNITKEASESTGLDQNTMVCVGAMDQICGAIGSANIKKGLISETTGTCLAMVATIDKPLFERKTNLPSYLHAVPNLFALLPYSFTGGVVLRWFKDNFCDSEIDESIREKKDIYNLLSSLASKAPAGSDGLIMLPHLAGAYFPEYNSRAKGVYFGINLAHKKGHFIRSIMESLGYMIRANLDSLKDTGIDFDKIISAGGGAKSQLWCQIKSDITGTIIEVPEYTETSLLGAAILAAVNIGKFKSIEEACKKFIKVKNVYYPDARNRDIYNEGYEKYKSIYRRLECLF